MGPQIEHRAFPCVCNVPFLKDVAACPCPEVCGFNVKKVALVEAPPEGDTAACENNVDEDELDAQLWDEHNEEESEVAATKRKGKRTRAVVGIQNEGEQEDAGQSKDVVKGKKKVRSIAKANDAVDQEALADDASIRIILDGEKNGRAKCKEVSSLLKRWSERIASKITDEDALSDNPVFKIDPKSQKGTAELVSDFILRYVYQKCTGMVYSDRVQWRKLEDSDNGIQQQTLLHLRTESDAFLDKQMMKDFSFLYVRDREK